MQPHRPAHRTAENKHSAKKVRGCRVPASLCFFRSDVVLQQSPQTLPCAFERARDRSDIDAVAVCDLTHGHRILIVMQQIPPLTFRKLVVPCGAYRTQKRSAGILMQIRFIRQTENQLRIEFQNLFADAPFSAAAYDCTSCSA